MRRVLLSPLLLAVAVASQDARGQMPELWRWVDADGIARYTPNPDHVPAAQRGTLVRVEPGMAKAPEPSHEVRPAAIFGPPGERPLEADPFNAPAPPRVEAVIVPPVPLETQPRDAAAPAAPARPAPAPAPPREDPAPAMAATPSPSPPRLAPAPPPAPASAVVPVARIEPEEVSLDAPAVPPGPLVAVPAEAPPAPLAAVSAEASPAPLGAVPAEAAPAPPPASAPAGDTAMVPAVAPPLPPAPEAAGAAPLAPELEARRAELIAAIARDEETLKAHVSAGEALGASPELREIAERLPALRAELRALEAQRATR